MEEGLGLWDQSFQFMAIWSDALKIRVGPCMEIALNPKP